MTKLICFDLDDTLTREIHSVMLLCMLHGRLRELLEIEKREAAGALYWIDADHQKAALIAGLGEDQVSAGFGRIMKPLRGIPETVEALGQRGIGSIVITAGPRQVAAAAAELWGFDAGYGSDYEAVDGVFTGRITRHIGDRGKIACLEQHCRDAGITPAQCVAVGDGSTDIPLFAHCESAIALNGSAAAKAKARFSVDTDDLRDILPYIPLNNNAGRIASTNQI